MLVCRLPLAAEKAALSRAVAPLNHELMVGGKAKMPAAQKEHPAHCLAHFPCNAVNQTILEDRPLQLG